FVLVIAPGGEELAVRREAVDLAAAAVGGVQHPLGVESQERGTTGAEVGVQLLRALAAELAGTVAALAPLGQELARGAQLRDAPVDVVAEEDRAVGADGQPGGELELAVAAPRLAPLAQQLAGGRVDGDAVLVEERHIDVAGAVEGDAAGLTGHRE